MEIAWRGLVVNVCTDGTNQWGLSENFHWKYSSDRLMIFNVNVKDNIELVLFLSPQDGVNYFEKYQWWKLCSSNPCIVVIRHICVI